MQKELCIYFKSIKSYNSLYHPMSTSEQIGRVDVHRDVGWHSSLNPRPVRSRSLAPITVLLINDSNAISWLSWVILFFRTTILCIPTWKPWGDPLCHSIILELLKIVIKTPPNNANVIVCDFYRCFNMSSVCIKQIHINFVIITIPISLSSLWSRVLSISTKICIKIAIKSLNLTRFLSFKIISSLKFSAHLSAHNIRSFRKTYKPETIQSKRK